MSIWTLSIPFSFLKVPTSLLYIVWWVANSGTCFPLLKRKQTYSFHYLDGTVYLILVHATLFFKQLWPVPLASLCRKTQFHFQRMTVCPHLSEAKDSLEVRFMCFSMVRPGCFSFSGVRELLLPETFFMVCTSVIDHLTEISKWLNLKIILYLWMGIPG